MTHEPRVEYRVFMFIDEVPVANIIGLSEEAVMEAWHKLDQAKVDWEERDNHYDVEERYGS